MSYWAEVRGVPATVHRMQRMQQDIMKVTRKTMRSAAKPWLAKAKAALPVDEWRVSIVARIRVQKLHKSDYLLLRAGFPATLREWGGAPDDFYKFYWQNYGTLKGRDPGHNFQRAPGRNNKNKNRSGIPHNNYFERAMSGAEEDIAAKLKVAIDKECERLTKEINSK